MLGDLNLAFWRLYWRVEEWQAAYHQRQVQEAASPRPKPAVSRPPSLRCACPQCRCSVLADVHGEVCHLCIQGEHMPNGWG
jgi:hypothetical protein